MLGRFGVRRTGSPVPQSSAAPAANATLSACEYGDISPVLSNTFVPLARATSTLVPQAARSADGAPTSERAPTSANAPTSERGPAPASARTCERTRARFCRSGRKDRYCLEDSRSRAPPWFVLGSLVLTLV